MHGLVRREEWLPAALYGRHIRRMVMEPRAHALGSITMRPDVRTMPARVAGGA